MTDSFQQELAQLLEDLCEGSLSATGAQRLEKLVLDDPQALETYLDTIEVHGLLHWDAAGLGAPDVEPAPLGSSPAAHVPTRRESSQRRRLTYGTLIAAIIPLAFAIWWLYPVQQQEIVNQPPIETPQPVAPENETTPSPTPPSVSLPGTTLAESGTAPGDDAHADAPPAGANPLGNLASANDAELVAWMNEQLARTWQDHDITPVSTAEDGVWVRRAYLDLVGRTPTLDEANAFLQSRDGDKRSQLIERLVGSREFSWNLATTWCNLLVGRTQGQDYDRNGLWQFLYHQFREHRPWRETVRELVAAEGSPETNGATNFLLAHLNNEAVPATAITARLFLGRQLQCVQCHNHPTLEGQHQDEFWEFNAFFEDTRAETRMIVDQETGISRRIVELVEDPSDEATYFETRQGVMRVAFPRFAGQEAELGNTPRRQQLAELLAEGPDPQLARAFVNRMWKHFFGYGLVNPVDDLGPHNHGLHPELLDGLASAFVARDYDVPALVRWICQSKAYQLSSLAADDETSDTPEWGDPPLFSRMYVKPLSPEQLFDALQIAAGTDPASLRGRNQKSGNRREWIEQFFVAQETEENTEDSTFDGTLSQALMMMNGDLVEYAVSGATGTLLSEVLNSPDGEVEKINRLFVAALSRYPTSEEINSIRQVLRRHVKQRTDRQIPARVAVNEGLRDVYWAVLNSTEFGINR